MSVITRPSATRQGIGIAAILLVLLAGVFGLRQANGAAGQVTTAGHPLVGSWAFDPEEEDPANPPSFTAFMADGILVNVGSDGTSVGSWEATGPRTATFTFGGLVAGDPTGSSFVIRGTLEVDDSGDYASGQHAFTMFAADGTVLVAVAGGGGEGWRLHPESMDAFEQPPSGYPTWTPATPAA
jgi:hypothetical protein